MDGSIDDVARLDVGIKIGYDDGQSWLVGAAETEIFPKAIEQNRITDRFHGRIVPATTKPGIASVGPFPDFMEPRDGLSHEKAVTVLMPYSEPEE